WGRTDGPRSRSPCGLGSRLRLPELLEDLEEQLDRAGRVAGVVVVEVGPDDRALVEQLLDPRRPVLHVLRAVDDQLLPGLGLLFDALAVADEAHVGPVG